MIHCDVCGKNEGDILVKGMGEMNKVEAIEELMKLFGDAKTQYREKGWFTSIGFDMCPECYKKENSWPDPTPKMSGQTCVLNG